MPQSVHDRAAELHNIPEHAAAAQATHSEPLKQDEHQPKAAKKQPAPDKLHHGKAAALRAARGKAKGKASRATKPAVSPTTHAVVAVGLGTLIVGLALAARA